MQPKRSNIKFAMNTWEAPWPEGDAEAWLAAQSFSSARQVFVAFKVQRSFMFFLSFGSTIFFHPSMPHWTDESVGLLTKRLISLKMPKASHVLAAHVLQ